jgi:hypothetical protein
MSMARHYFEEMQAGGSVASSDDGFPNSIDAKILASPLGFDVHSGIEKSYPALGKMTLDDR